MEDVNGVLQLLKVVNEVDSWWGGFQCKSAGELELCGVGCGGGGGEESGSRDGVGEGFFADLLVGFVEAELTVSA
jgi:hypothetical protein